MSEKMSTEQILKIISKAWGRQKGYCFFPTISGVAANKRERIMSYAEGPAFKWPTDRAKIIAYMELQRDNDLYWCPSLFEEPHRNLELAMDEHALWADLDAVDPRDIHDYPPTIAWETSPGRFQAVWIMASGDIQGASWAGRENQKLTYHLGADPSGWDTTQLLRVPTWNNHKPDYRRENNGKPVRGKLLWSNGRQWLADEFDELPDVPTVVGEIADVLEDEIDHVDRHAVWGRVRLKVSGRVREFIGAREASGDRSEILWEIERELADAGCSVTEIVAIVRASVWNKYEGRADELRRLTTEAAKAISQRSEAAVERALEEVVERPRPTNLFALVRDLKPPTWLIRDILTAGAVGFIAGQPKSFKSWAGLDMALSVASGQPFLGHFTIERPGPTLYLQEEDSGPLVKQRLGKVWPGKIADKLSLGNGGEEPGLYWDPPLAYEDSINGKMGDGVDIDAYIGQTVTLSDPSWQAWLDDTLAWKAGQVEGGYKLLVLDPLMMMAGEVEENRAQEMTTKIFRPLKDLARKWHVAIQMIHHMKKTDPKAGPQRGGQMLLGSVANHAWAEDSLYFKLARGGDVVCEQESKNAPVPGFRMTGIRNRRWDPVIVVNRDNAESEPDGAEGPIRSTPGNDRKRSSSAKPARESKAVTALRSLGPGAHAVREVADAGNISIQSVYAAMGRAIKSGAVKKVGTQFLWVGESMEVTADE